MQRALTCALFHAKAYQVPRAGVLATLAKVPNRSKFTCVVDTGHKALTSVGAPLAGMNDLNLGIHLHKHTKQPTLLKTSLSCSVNYFVINHNLARSPDARRARRESMTPCMQAVIIPYSRDSFIRNEYSTHQTSSAANLRLSMRALIINLPAHDEPYSDCRLPMT